MRYLASNRANEHFDHVNAHRRNSFADFLRTHILHFAAVERREVEAMKEVEKEK